MNVETIKLIMVGAIVVWLAWKVVAQQAALNAMRKRKDAAYQERNEVVALLATLYPSGIARTVIDGWDSEWHNCVYIELPFSGQVSWHYHDDHRHLFAGLPAYRLQWDGHDTPTKYRRVSDQRIRNMFTAGVSARAQLDAAETKL